MNVNLAKGLIEEAIKNQNSEGDILYVSWNKTKMFHWKKYDLNKFIEDNQELI